VWERGGKGGDGGGGKGGEGGENEENERGEGESAGESEGGGGKGEGEKEEGEMAWVLNEWGSYRYLMGDLEGACGAFERSLEADPGACGFVCCFLCR
jgi:hypothetical protein